MGLAERTYRVTRVLPPPDRFGLVAQLERAIVSVPSNIAEGNSRRTITEYVHFLCVARGSLGEYQTQLLLARAVGIIPALEASELLEGSGQVGRLLGGLIRALEQKRRQQQKNGKPDTRSPTRRKRKDE